MHSHQVHIAEYDIFDKRWSARTKVLHGPIAQDDYIDYLMRNKWTSGAGYGRAIYRVNLPDGRKRYYYRGTRVGRKRFLQLIEQGGDYCELEARKALGGE
jgi:hypothetical protein